MRALVHALLALLILCVLAGIAGCAGGAATGGEGDDGGGGGDEPGDGDAPPTKPVTGTAARYTYQLQGGSKDLKLWTTPPHAKVFAETTRSPLPDSTDEELRLYAARNEYEPIQLVVWSSAAGNATVGLPSFGIGETVSLHSVEYVDVTTPTDSGGEAGLWPDPLLPRQAGEAIPLSAGRNKPLWITVYVPASAAAGEYEGTLTVAAPGGSTQIPVKLHVFDFALPAEIGLKSQMNVSHQALGGGASLERVEEIKSFFHAHRLTPKSVAWPAGLNYNGGITYDCVSQSFDDSDGGAYSFSQLGPKYVDGQGWNGVGFPSFMAFQFVDNSTPRPAEFCGTSIGADAYGTAAYNTRWQAMLSALDAYLVEHGYEEKAYHYLMNEPQDQDDYDLAAFLASMSKAVAPNLRLAISEEPKEEIYDNSRFGGASFDIWIANIPAYDQARSVALERQSEHGEEVWWYSLPHDAPPYFNPTTIDHIGLESRLLGLAAFALRADGYAYYSLTGWGDPWDNPNPGNGNGDGFLLYPEPGTTESPTRFIPSIRLELLREAFEDYEYLLLANGGKPAAGSAAVADPTAQSAVSSLTSWTRDAEGVSELRMQLGRYVAGERSDLPVLVPDAPARERGAYYINFQDPAGEPSDDPLVVDGNEYLKLGWEAWSDAAGYGWFGENIGTDRVKTQWLENLPVVDPRQRSIIYDDWGRKTVFEFALESGAYDVTVSVGWANRGSYQHQRVIAEGVGIIEPGDTTTVNDRFYIVDTERVELTDGKLTLEVGGVVADGDYRYTMLNYVDIVPAE